jgi:ATP synthase F1 complex assembly factor 2
MLKLAFRSLPVIATRSNVGYARKYATEGTLKSVFTSTPLGQDSTVETNIKSDTNRLAKTLSKFWEKVNVSPDDATGAYKIQLDGKTIKTPLGFPMELPGAKKQLAYLISHEWANLPDLKIKTHSLPLTSITARAIDLTNCHQRKDVDPDLVTKVGNLQDIKHNMLRYFDTDTCLILATHKEYHGKLRQKQDELYMALVKELEDFFTAYGKKHNLLPSADYQVKIEYLDCETDGLRGNEQNAITQNIVLHWMDQLSMYDLVALEKAILTSKSFLCGASLLRSNCSNTETMKDLYQVNKSGVDDYFHKTIEEIVELGNLETIFQTEEWGEVEDTHDVDKVDWLRNLTAAALLCH